jgi:transglutaminase-like putative cysteine protease
MKRSYLIIAAGCVLLVCGLILVKVFDWHFGAESTYVIPRRIHYSFTLQNRTSRIIKGAEFWTYAPVKHTPTQQCMSVNASQPFQVIMDDQGNQILYFTFSTLPPYTTKIIAIEAELLLSDTPNRVPETDLLSYLQEERYCESGSPEIARLAKRLQGADPLKTAENIFRWVASSLRYSGYVRNPRGALYALRNKTGDCTEFMYLFAALCRANNIPARGIGGYVVRENAVLKPNGYHNWAEFYHDGVWRIADPQRNRFMQHQSHYLAMQVLSQSPENPMGKYHRFRCANESLTAKMNG